MRSRTKAMTSRFASLLSSAHVKRPPLDLAHRSDEAEWLDGADLSPADLANVLRDLAAFNGMFLGRYPLLRWLGRAVLTSRSSAPLTLVDVGCGYGDLLRAIRRW